MIKCDWANIDGWIGSAGGRGVEVPYMRRIFKDVRNKRLADFAGDWDNGRYHVDPSNECHRFELHDKKVHPLHHGGDLTDPVKPELLSYFDMGICVSALEHVGLCAYGDKADENGDIKVFTNIIQMIKTGCPLYVTVPSALDEIEPLGGWTRSYTPQMIMDRFQANATSQLDIIYYRYVDRKAWWECETSEELPKYHDGDIDGIAVIKYTR